MLVATVTPLALQRRSQHTAGGYSPDWLKRICADFRWIVFAAHLNWPAAPSTLDPDNRLVARLVGDSGRFQEMRELRSWDEEFCVDGDVVVTRPTRSADDNVVRRLAFPQKDYPEKPATLRSNSANSTVQRYQGSALCELGRASQLQLVRLLSPREQRRWLRANEPYVAWDREFFLAARTKTPAIARNEYIRDELINILRQADRDLRIS